MDTQAPPLPLVAGLQIRNSGQVYVRKCAVILSGGSDEGKRSRNYSAAEGPSKCRIKSTSNNK